MPKYYIASGLANFAQVQELRDLLNGLGWEHTYDWTVHNGARTAHELLPTVGMAEIEGVVDAEVVIGLLPGGRGTHIEIGAAIVSALCDRAATAAGIPRPISGEADTRVVLYSPDPEQDFGPSATTCVFYHHPLVERFSSMSEMIKSLLA